MTAPSRAGAPGSTGRRVVHVVGVFDGCSDEARRNAVAGGAGGPAEVDPAVDYVMSPTEWAELSALLEALGGGGTGTCQR